MTREVLLTREGLAKLEAELERLATVERAAVTAPYVPWRKAAGRPMRLSATFTRADDGAVQAPVIVIDGDGVALSASGSWRPAGEGRLVVSSARLADAFEGSLEFAAGDDGERLITQARYFDARKLIAQGGKPTAGPARAGVQAATPLRIDARLDRVRVSEQGMVRNVGIRGAWGGAGGQGGGQG